MLNENKERELAYLIKVDAIESILGSDNCEAAVVGGWRVMVRKGSVKAGDTVVYFEIDSKLPETETYEFLAKKHYKVKTQKYTFGGANPAGFYSQGLVMPLYDFPAGTFSEVMPTNENPVFPIFVTKLLGVTYAVDDDNKRKGKSPDKYAKMAQRRPEIFKQSWARWFMQREWGKKLMFFLFGRKRDSKGWPEWVVKTDEERVQNLVHMLDEYSKENWIATEKVDGTSTTFTLKRLGRRKFDYRVCSRNVNMTQRKDGSWYETNVYTEMAQKYDMEKVLHDMLNDYTDAVFVTVQAETYGEGIQKRDYSTKEHKIAVFNIIFGYADGHTERLNPEEGECYALSYNLPYVPIVGRLKISNNCDEILELAGGSSALDGLPREGLVFRSFDGQRSFKAVDNQFIVKYHG